MIVIKNTPHLTGVTISGDFNDLYNLVEAFYDIAINECSEKHRQYIGISTRVLGLCYDIRHAYQGDREVELVDNNMTGDLMKWHGLIAPKNNVYYSCNILYPEMFFNMLALNALIKARIMDLTKSKIIFEEALDRRVIWDKTIASLHVFQAEFSACVMDTLSQPSFARWINVMNGKYLYIEDIAGQYVDLLNIQYIKMSKEKRLKSLSSIARKMADFSRYGEHREIKDVVTGAAKEYNCDPGEIRLQGIEYPDEFEW